MCRVVAALVVIVACPCVLSADTVVDLSPGGLVTGIRGLEVGGNTYDVGFVVGSFVDVFGPVSSPSPLAPFWGDYPGADAAAAAIAALINAEMDSSGLPPAAIESSGPWAGAVIPAGPWTTTPSLLTGSAFNNPDYPSVNIGSWTHIASGGGGFSATGAFTVFATFAAIPLPAALWLGLCMFTGMGVVGGWQKRRK